MCLRVNTAVLYYYEDSNAAENMFLINNTGSSKKLIVYFFPFCIESITAPPGFLIRLDFRDYFQIEPSDECKFDYLEVCMMAEPAYICKDS